MKSYKIYVRGKFTAITSDKVFADFMNKGNKPNVVVRLWNFLFG